MTRALPQGWMRRDGKIYLHQQHNIGIHSVSDLISDLEWARDNYRDPSIWGDAAVTYGSTDVTLSISGWVEKTAAELTEAQDKEEEHADRSRALRIVHLKEMLAHLEEQDKS